MLVKMGGKLLAYYCFFFVLFLNALYCRLSVAPAIHHLCQCVVLCVSGVCVCEFAFFVGFPLLHFL